MTTDRKATAAALAAIAAKYHPPRYVLALEVWSGSHEESRFVDAVAVDLYNRDLTAFEIKASRQDAQRDLLDGEKSRWARERVDYFYLVEARPDLVDTVELPERWGLWTLRDGCLDLRHAANRLPQQAERTELVVGVLKRVVAGPKGDALREVREASFREGLAKGKEDYDYRLERAEQRVARLEKALRARGPPA